MTKGRVELYKGRLFGSTILSNVKTTSYTQFDVGILWTCVVIEH